MPVTNPVNNASNAATAQINCAFCSLCGTLDSSNFGGLLGFFFTTVFPQANVNTALVEAAFSLYWESENHAAHDDARSLERQIAGVRLFLSRMVPTGRAVSVDQGGAADLPLEIADAETFIDSYPTGTRFAYLIGAWNDDFHAFTGAHWLTAVRTGTGIQYIDYQMDVAPGIRQAVSLATHVPQGNLAAPSVTAAPRRPWGSALDPDDRAVVLAYLPFDP